MSGVVLLSLMAAAGVVVAAVAVALPATRAADDGLPRWEQLPGLGGKRRLRRFEDAKELVVGNPPPQSRV